MARFTEPVRGRAEGCVVTQTDGGGGTRGKGRFAFCVLCPDTSFEGKHAPFIATLPLVRFTNADILFQTPGTLLATLALPQSF